MRFKVGDLVEYRGVTVRVMRAKDGDITLAKFGSFREDNPEIKLVLSATLPELKTGDLVRVCGIPESEKHAYGCFWSDHMDNLIGQIVTVRQLRSTNEIVKIGGWNFHTYHLKPVNKRQTNDFDMV